MSIFENKPLAILVGINIVSFMLIFWLIGMLMGRDSTPPPVAAAYAPAAVNPAAPQAGMQNAARRAQQAITSAPSPAPTSSPAKPAQAVSASIADAIENELAGASANTAAPAEPEEPVIIEKTTTIDVYYDGNIAHIEKTDDDGNKTISISNNLKEVEQLSESDAAYLAAYRKMKSGEISHMTMFQVTQEEARQIQAKQQAQTEMQVDYFNKVEVAKANVTAKQPSLAQQIQALVRDPQQGSAPVKPIARSVSQPGQDYMTALKAASKERINETRTIRVKPGDSLWKIAVRAYGSGYDFPRIYQANPHIKNPDMIRVGEILRVPL